MQIAHCENPCNGFQYKSAMIIPFQEQKILARLSDLSYICLIEILGKEIHTKSLSPDAIEPPIQECNKGVILLS
jgi:hypothetical protein